MGPAPMTHSTVKTVATTVGWASMRILRLMRKKCCQNNSCPRRRDQWLLMLLVAVFYFSSACAGWTERCGAWRTDTSRISVRNQFAQLAHLAVIINSPGTLGRNHKLARNDLAETIHKVCCKNCKNCINCINSKIVRPYLSL